MKKIFYLLTLAAIFLSVGLSAQTPKKYDFESTVDLPSYIYYKRPPFDVPRSFKATSKMQYYYDQNDNKVLDGPVTIVGGYVKPAVRTAATSFGEYKSSVNITAAAEAGVMKGPFTGTYSESQESGERKLSFTLSVKTNFKNAAMGGYLTVDRNLSRDGQDSKAHWYIHKDDDANLKSIDVLTDGITCKVTFDENGEATGDMSASGFVFKLSKNVLTNYFLRKNGEMCACEDEHNQLLSKYVSGEYTKNDLVKAGYILKKYTDVEISLEEHLLRCVNLYPRDLGEFEDISFPMYVLARVDVFTLDKMIALLTPEGNNYPISWDVSYDEETCQLEYGHGWSTISEYAAKSDFDEFSRRIDSLARVETETLVDYWLKNTLKGVERNNLGGRLSNRDIYWPSKVLGNYAKAKYNIDTIEKVEREYHATATVECGIGNEDGPVVRTIVVSVGMTNNGKGFSVNVVSDEVVASEWDTYRAEKVETVAAVKKLMSTPENYDQASFNNYSNYVKEYNLNALSTAQESIAALAKLIQVSKDFLKHDSNLKDMLAKNKSVVEKLNAYPEVLAAYNTYFGALDYSWTEAKSQSVWAPVLALITSTDTFVEKRKVIDANNAELAVTLANAKNVAKAYKTYSATLDLTLPQDANSNNLDAIIKVQEDCKSLLAYEGLEQFVKEIKKQKLVTLEDMIAYAKEKGVIAK